LKLAVARAAGPAPVDWETIVARKKELCVMIYLTIKCEPLGLFDVTEIMLVECNKVIRKLYGL
jgi:hypothetical protein